METTSTLSNNLWSFYFKTLLESAEKKLVIQPFGKKMLHPKRTGKDSYILKYGNIADDVNELSEGIVPTEGTIDTNKYTVSMKWYGKHLRVTDQLILTAIDPVLEDFADRLGYHAAKTADSVIRNVLVANATANTQYVGSGIVADVGVTATDVFVAQDAIKGVRLLKGDDAPSMDDGLFAWVVHSLIGMDIQADTSAGGFIELNKYVAGLADKPLNGEIGKVYGARVVESNNISSVANAGAVNVYRTLMLARQPFAFTSLDSDFTEMIIKQVGSSGIADPLNQVGSVGYKMAFGCTYIGGTFSNEEGASPDLCIQIRGAATGG